MRWLLLILLTGCAAAGQAPSMERAQPGKVVFERILGTQTATPQFVLYLTPALAERYFDRNGGDAGFPRLVATFERIGAPGAEAAARLNWGAVLWNLGREEEAYQELVRAKALFERVGDIFGMAHAHEWLGHTLLVSGATERAGAHLAVAYQLFEKLGNEPAATRVLSYGE